MAATAPNITSFHAHGQGRKRMGWRKEDFFIPLRTPFIRDQNLQYPFLSSPLAKTGLPAYLTTSSGGWNNRVCKESFLAGDGITPHRNHGQFFVPWTLSKGAGRDWERNEV